MAAKHKDDDLGTLAEKHSSPSKGDKKHKKAKKNFAEVDTLAAEGGTKRPSRYDLTYTQNRELSWLKFDNRVLTEAFDESVPLYERLKFVSIFFSNLDEFFMVRVGGLSDLATLKRQPVENKENLTASEQIDRIFADLAPLIKRAQTGFNAIEEELEDYGVERLRPNDLTDEERTFVEQYFRRYLAPIISPLVIDPRHPFPNLRNGALYLVCGLDSVDEKDLLGLIEVPSHLPRTVEVRVKSQAGQAYRYILIEDIVMACLDSCFGSFMPTDRAVIRVTRNADIDPDGEGVEEDDDYRQHMKRILKQRLRLQPVRLEVEGHLKKDDLKVIRKALKLSSKAVNVSDMPLDLGYVYAVEDKIPEASRAEVLFRPVTPQPSPMVVPGRSMREQVMKGDKLLFYPYESMDPFLDLVHEAAHDPECISIRITLYRVAKQSRLCESLISASEDGKEVTVLMELRARFDEANNIQWAERLEAAGCTVIYGSEGFKCHSKICQITYRTGLDVSRITLLGTGNFNEKTAKLYSDFMLMTAHPGIGEDGNAFFRNLSLGNLRGSYKYLGVAPVGLKPLIMTGLNREIERARAGEEAYAFFKMNSLTDREVIDKISEASRAGVRVEMIIRGICCLKPGIPGKTDNVHVRSIVGRFLEHARVYSFGVEADTLYLSSADMMTRNTEHRVEIAFPVLDPECRDLVRSYMHMQLSDNVKARVLSSEGQWETVPRHEGEEPFNSQQYMILNAYRRAQEAVEKREKEEKRAHAPEAKPMSAAVPEFVPGITAPATEHTAATQQDAPAAPNTTAHSIAEPATQREDTQASAPDKAPKAPKMVDPPVSRVEATIIEPPAVEAETEPSRPGKHRAPKKRGRLRTSLALIRLGIKTLVSPTSAEREIRALESSEGKRRTRTR